MSTDDTYDIHKAAGIIIRDRKLLLCRDADEDIFVAPGGKPEGNETIVQALIREIKEEVDLDIAETDLKPFETFYAMAATHANKRLRMDTFFIATSSDPKPSGEIAELFWVNSLNQHDKKIGSIFHHDVLPKLKALGLVD